MNKKEEKAAHQKMEDCRAFMQESYNGITKMRAVFEDLFKTALGKTHQKIPAASLLLKYSLALPAQTVQQEINITQQATLTLRHLEKTVDPQVLEVELKRLKDEQEDSDTRIA